jgi:hypothetical protein
MRNANRQVRFEVERGKLVRHVTRPHGRGYTQRAALAALEEIVRFLEAQQADGATTTDLWDALPELPATQISVALDFLKEQGCVVSRCRRSYAASSFLFEDAMIEYHALAGT